MAFQYMFRVRRVIARLICKQLLLQMYFLVVPSEFLREICTEVAFSATIAFVLQMRHTHVGFELFLMIKLLGAHRAGYILDPIGYNPPTGREC